MNNKKVFYALLTSEGAILWISATTLLQIIVDTNWSSPVMLALFTLILFVVVYLTSKQQCETILLNSTIASFKETEDVETYCRILLDTVSVKGQTGKVSLEGIITMHSISCNRPHCVCKKLTQNAEEAPEIEAQVSDADCGGTPEKPAKKGFDTVDVNPKKSLSS
jgi:alpha-N-acetylglucosamine transferase